jgi:hypothetical protein
VAAAPPAAAPAPAAESTGIVLPIVGGTAVAAAIVVGLLTGVF